MKKVNKLMKSITAFLLALLMFFSLPSAVYAYIGAVVTGDSAVTHGVGLKDGNETYAYIENDYIHFDVCIASRVVEHLGMVGSHAHTIPKSAYDTYDKKKYSLDDFGAQNITIMKAPVNSYDAELDEYNIGNYTPMVVTRVDPRFDVDDYFPMYEGDTYPAHFHGDLALDYRFGTGNNGYTVHTYFTLVKLNEGSHTNTDMNSVPVDDNDETVNWGVSCTTYVESDKVFREFISEDKTGTGNPDTGAGFTDRAEYHMENNTFFKVDMEFVDFAKMGHETITQAQLKDIAVNAETRSESGMLSQTVISNGVSATAPNTVTETYVGSYSTAAPFVACSYYYYHSMAGGVENHNCYYPESIEYAGNSLKTYTPGYWAFTQKNTQIILDETISTTTKYANEFSGLWGFRNLMLQDEIEQQEIEPDKFDIKGDAQYLAVFPDGAKKDDKGKQVYKVLPAATADEIKTLEKTNGTCVAQYRGDYTVETNSDGSVKYYKFTAGVAALSASVTATWNAVNSYFRLKPDGTPEFDQNAVSLNAPTFKFYEAKDGGGLTFDGYDSKLGVKFGIKPDKNSATINISLPGNSVQVKGASIDTKGNLVFTGKFKMNLFVAQMEMLKLGYGLNSKAEFVCNGVHAKGKLKVPKAPGKDKEDDEDAKPNVLGFGGAQMEGEVNTFPGEELYDFKFELTVKNLFSTKAELTLVRLKNGRLCPEHLYFELKAEAEGAGIDLTPGTPAVTITGGGGGIDGLASTIDGNYTCIPPVVLTLVTYGQVIKVVDGKLTAQIGPSILKLSGSDLGFKIGDSNLEIVDSLYAGVYLTGKEITYGTSNIAKRTYRGVTFGGSLGIGVKIFNFKDDKDPLASTLKFFNNTISASASLGAETFAGGATDNSKWMYLYVGAYGNASCSLNIPAGVPAIGGKALLGAALDFKIGAQTAFETGNGGDSAKQFFKNASITGGIAATGYVWPVYGRVIYVLPDKVKLQGKLFNELEPIKWDDILVDSQSGQNAGIRTVALSEPEMVETEDGEQAIAYAQANIAPVKTRLLANNNTRSTFTKTVAAGTANIADGEHLVLAVVPKNAEDIDALENSISCDKLDSLNWLPDVIPETDTDPGYNVWRSTYEADEEGNVVKEAVYLSLTKEQAAKNSGKTSVTAGVDFDIRGLATTPVTALNASLSGDVVSATIENPEAEKHYALYTYLGKKTLDENGKEQISADYCVEARDITNTAGVQAITLNTSGNIAPTGDYYVTTALVEKTKVTVKNDNGTEEEIDAEIPVDSKVSDATYHYVNTTVPTAPQNVSLELIGNESMKASWKKADNADGYKLTIYQKDGDEWVDTGRGYNLTNEDFSATQGLAYDEASKTYSIEMAMTVGGDGKASTLTSSDGDTVQISAEAAKEIAALEAGKNYKVGVQAYKSNTLLLDGEASDYDEYSAETQSEAKLLPVYKPVTFDVSVGGETITPDENGVYNAVVNNNGYAIIPSNAKSGNADVSANTVFTVNQVNLTDDSGNDYSVPLDEVYADEFRMPDFEGTIALEISAKYTHDGVTDETLAYVYVSKDNVAPVITLDEETFYADKNGDYTVTGMTEPGATVLINGEQTVIADENGAFTYSANLGGELSAVVNMTATDENGNESETVSTIITGVVDISGASVSGVVNKTYTGAAQTQELTVTLADGTILDETAYDIAYVNNVNAGTATVTVTGKGNYTGTLTKTFTIAKLGLTGATIKGVTNRVYSGKAQTQNVTVTLNGKTLPASAYSVTYVNNTNAGNASVIISGKNNYNGSKIAYFTIAKAANPLKLKAKKPTVKYAKLKKKKQSLALKKAVTVSGAQGKKTYALSSAKLGKKNFKKKFTVNKKTGKITLKKRLKKGTYKVKIKVTAAGNGNYNKATKTVTVKIKVK